jgi:hypothetical protein
MEHPFMEQNIVLEVGIERYPNALGALRMDPWRQESLYTTLFLAGTPNEVTVIMASGHMGVHSPGICRYSMLPLV